MQGWSQLHFLASVRNTAHSTKGSRCHNHSVLGGLDYDCGYNRTAQVVGLGRRYCGRAQILAPRVYGSRHRTAAGFMIEKLISLYVMLRKPRDALRSFAHLRAYLGRFLINQVLRAVPASI